ncbi:hypothetical protein HJG60_009159 [Phyllostomus discolor]|uniref:Uncharacterized protein n=1 Tax=Phyllostomus discolor TaxID=89673 RepID=A0A833YME7_9CHIR|nr:hypothetical protein HJG60_009159 [Phyllostomus discolor]
MPPYELQRCRWVGPRSAHPALGPDKPGGSAALLAEATTGGVCAAPPHRSLLSCAGAAVQTSSHASRRLPGLLFFTWCPVSQINLRFSINALGSPILYVQLDLFLPLSPLVSPSCRCETPVCAVTAPLGTALAVTPPPSLFPPPFPAPPTPAPTVGAGSGFSSLKTKPIPCPQSPVLC